VASSYVSRQAAVSDGMLSVQIAVRLIRITTNALLIVSSVSIIMFIILHVHYLLAFTRTDNKGVAITMPVIFRQAELLFSLFSAAIPALNQYLRKFSTQGTPGSYSVYGDGGGYGLKSLTRTTKKSHFDSMASRDGFVSERHGNYKATVEHQGRDENDSSADGISLGRHNSDEMIIRKDVVYDVTYSDGDHAGSRASNSPSVGRY